MDDDTHGVAVPARTVPFPSSISAEARAMLARAVRADGVPLNTLHVLPDPADHPAWIDLKTAADAHYATAMEALAGTLRSTVETVTIAETTIHVATPVAGPEATFKTGRAYIDLHGGALVFGGGLACRVGARMQANQHGMRCYGVDYRTPPEHPFPAALDDCLVAYRHVLTHHAASDIVIGGRSAGGNLAIAMLRRARDAGLPMPAGLVLLSPQADLTESGDSFSVNQLVDVVLPGSLMATSRLYANGADLADPDLSPLFGDLAGLPATLLQTGTRDLFLSTTVRLHRALRRAGVAAELHVFEAMPHGGFGGDTPEDRDMQAEVARFVSERWR
ncbi:alpha/beta hydrolase [Sphingomonas sp. PAMC 26621]|uniref:alpha/beta hydrolase n=1 Tax=Sphingomonas sp. PAMC 26621 TaxID=1112213 RepID=UPI000287F88E|nr:alpha/beta hydrolase [Sphingomonas sp. PAMC 26621]